MKVASAQYEISFVGNWDNYVNKIEQWVQLASNHQAQILLFPEYFSMELASLFSKEVYSSLSNQLLSIQSYFNNFLNLFSELSVRYGVYICAGSFPVRLNSGEYRNRSYFFNPQGTFDFQEKLIMTRFENESWFISPGAEIKVFDSEFGKIGINICYDSEFPLIARSQAERGAHLILVPSCTDTLAGYHRVKIGSQARALENQCIVIQSPTVGEAKWSEAIDVNVGAAGIYTPVDNGFPSDGILSIGKLNQPQWIYAEFDLNQVQQVRENGQVFNFKDWPKQLIK